MRRLVVLGLLSALIVPSASTAAELRTRALLDMTLSSGTEAQLLNTYTQGDANVDPYRLRLFLDARVSPTLDVYLQTILHEGWSRVTADGAYVQWTPWAERDAHVQAGKVPWPIGSWGAREYSDRNPLVGAPLMYQYHCSLAWNVPAASVDQLVGSAGTGQAGVMYGTQAGAGMPVVDDRWWDVGVVAIGSARPLEYSLAVMQGSPGWPVNGRDVTPGQSTMGRLGLAPLPGVRLGVSGDYGTWMPEWFSYAAPASRSLRDYHEFLAMSDLELSRGPWELHAEAFRKGWETFGTGTLRLRGGYAEARVALGVGAWLAARADAMRFSDVTTSANIVRPWDDGVDRFEAGIGYRVNHDVRLKAAVQRNVRHAFGAARETEDLVALAASIRL